MMRNADAGEKAIATSTRPRRPESAIDISRDIKLQVAKSSRRERYRSVRAATQMKMHATQELGTF